jgi:hypothetical protein
MACFVPSMIDEFCDFIRSKAIGSELPFSMDDKDENWMWHIFFGCFEVHNSNTLMYTITWHDDDDEHKSFQHKAVFFLYRNDWNRTLGGVESALVTMLDRFHCHWYAKQIMQALFLTEDSDT